MSFRLFLFLCVINAAVATHALGQVGAGAAGASQQILPNSGLLRDYGKDLSQNLSFTYYFSFLGPSAGLGYGETYNLFRNGKAPYQMLHTGNLAYKLNPEWTVGFTLAGVNDVTERAKTGEFLRFGNTPAENRMVNTYNTNEREWFNARVYVNLPTLGLSWGFLTTNFAVELPTSNIARRDGLKHGLVLTNALGIFTADPRWSFGFTNQIIRFQYDDPEFPPFEGATTPTRLQTMLITFGPYLNYSISEDWQLANLIALDWQKVGDQTMSEFDNNLPHRGRVAFNRLIRNSYLTRVGFYSQFLLDPMESETTVFGFDFLVQF